MYFLFFRWYTPTQKIIYFIKPLKLLNLFIAQKKNILNNAKKNYIIKLKNNNIK